MTVIHFEGYLAVPTWQKPEELKDKLFNVITAEFEDELETMSCGFEKWEDE